VVVVDDVVDSGRTFERVLEEMSYYRSTARRVGLYLYDDGGFQTLDQFYESNPT
jgi:hypoxanthine phosphoribosyltransferase